jgi:hypothetical protein
VARASRGEHPPGQELGEGKLAAPGPEPELAVDQWKWRKMTKGIDIV